jgi:hypothetical protein
MQGGHCPHGERARRRQRVKIRPEIVSMQNTDIVLLYELSQPSNER